MKYFELNEGFGLAPDVGTLVEYNGRQYRVSSWLKKKPEPEFAENDWDEMLQKILHDTQRELGPDKVKLVWCSRKEAEYLSLSGVGGAIAKITDVRVTGRVDWSEKLLGQERDRANWLIGKTLD